MLDNNTILIGTAQQFGISFCLDRYIQRIAADYIEEQYPTSLLPYQLRCNLLLVVSRAGTRITANMMDGSGTSDGAGFVYAPFTQIYNGRGSGSGSGSGSGRGSADGAGSSGAGPSTYGMGDGYSDGQGDPHVSRGHGKGDDYESNIDD